MRHGIDPGLVDDDSQGLAQGSLSGDGPVGLAKRIESARRGYLSALKMLAQVRRLIGPSVQVVNVGDNNRTNVVGPALCGA